MWCIKNLIWNPDSLWLLKMIFIPTRKYKLSPQHASWPVSSVLTSTTHSSCEDVIQGLSSCNILSSRMSLLCGGETGHADQDKSVLVGVKGFNAQTPRWLFHRHYHRRLCVKSAHCFLRINGAGAKRPANMRALEVSLQVSHSVLQVYPNSCGFKCNKPVTKVDEAGRRQEQRTGAV